MRVGKYLCKFAKLWIKSFQLHIIYIIPLLTHWNYVSFALTHRQPYHSNVYISQHIPNIVSMVPSLKTKGRQFHKLVVICSKLSLRQLMVPPVTTKLLNWRYFVFSEGNIDRYVLLNWRPFGFNAWIFPEAPLKVNGAARNIQGNARALHALTTDPGLWSGHWGPTLRSSVLLPSGLQSPHRPHREPRWLPIADTVTLSVPLQRTSTPKSVNTPWKEEDVPH